MHKKRIVHAKETRKKRRKNLWEMHKEREGCACQYIKEKNTSQAMETVLAAVGE